jgi:hypothetical protein
MKKFLFSLLLLSSSAFVFGQNSDDKTIERNDLKDFTKVSVELLANRIVFAAASLGSKAALRS